MKKSVLLLIILFALMASSAYGAREVNCTLDNCADLVGYWKLNEGPEGITQILDIGEEGNWDTALAYSSTVIKDGDTYHMWYTGSDGINYRILYTNGTSPTSWNTPVQALSNNLEGNWDTAHAFAPTVLKDDITYHMWYAGYDGTNWRILYTNSTDRVNWNTPVQSLSNNVQGVYDTTHASHPMVIKDGSTYKM